MRYGIGMALLTVRLLKAKLRNTLLSLPQGENIVVNHEAVKDPCENLLPNVSVTISEVPPGQVDVRVAEKVGGHKVDLAGIKNRDPNHAVDEVIPDVVGVACLVLGDIVNQVKNALLVLLQNDDMMIVVDDHDLEVSVIVIEIGTETGKEIGIGIGKQNENVAEVVVIAIDTVQVAMRGIYVIVRLEIEIGTGTVVITNNNLQLALPLLHQRLPAVVVLLFQLHQN